MPGQTMEAEEAGHPLERAREMSGSIGLDMSIGQPEFERNRRVRSDSFALFERAEQGLCFPVASEEHRRRIGRVGSISVLPAGMVQQGDAISLFAKEIGRRQSRQAGA